MDCVVLMETAVETSIMVIMPNIYMAPGCQTKKSPKDRKEKKISVQKYNEP